MAANYVLLEKITVGAAGAASVTFNNIPQTGYTDLKVVTSTRSTTSNSTYPIAVIVYPNGSSANGSHRYLYGNGSTASAGSAGSYIRGGESDQTNWTANTFGNSEFYIPNYTSSNYKSISVNGVAENNGTTAAIIMNASLWSSNAAITSLQIVPELGNWSQYSTFSL
jgi:hypothetical protein